jgi:glycosyltransferase involved in cell wall biosynthesis
MRVGFDAKRAFFNHSGLGNYSRFIIDSLNEYYGDNDYILYTPKLKGDFLNELPGEFKTPTGFGKYVPSLWRVRHLGKRAVADDIDVFHGLSNEIPADLKSPNIKKIVTIHDVIFKRYPQFYKTIDRKIYDRKTRYSCELADEIVAVSSQTKEDLINFYQVEERKIKVIGQDCHQQFQELQDSHTVEQTKSKYGISKPYLISVGTIESRKNQANIAGAFLASDLCDDFELHFFGRRTEYQQEVEKVIEGKAGVKIHNNADFSDFPSLYQGSLGMVYVSLFEGFGIPLVEAMHSKIPILTSKSGCFTEVSGTGGIYVDPLEVDEIKEEMENMVRDTDLRTNLLSKQRLQLAQFSAEEIARQLMEVYNG